MKIRSVHSGMAARRPAGSHSQEIGVIHLTDDKIARLSLNLAVTTETKIGIPAGQHLVVDAPVRVVACDATFSHRFMFEHKRAGLFGVALGAAFIQPCHGQPSGRLHNIKPVRIMALHTLHLTFRNRMMMRKTEFRMHIQMTLITRGRIILWVEDPIPFPSRRGYMEAPRTMTGFTAGLSLHDQALRVNDRVRAGPKLPRDFRMTSRTGLVSDKFRPFDGRRCHDRTLDRGTGTEQESKCG